MWCTGSADRMFRDWERHWKRAYTIELSACESWRLSIWSSQRRSDSPVQAVLSEIPKEHFFSEQIPVFSVIQLFNRWIDRSLTILRKVYFSSGQQCNVWGLRDLSDLYITIIYSLIPLHICYFNENFDLLNYLPYIHNLETLITIYKLIN